MQATQIDCMGKRLTLWTHDDPDPLARVITRGRYFHEGDLLMACRTAYLPGTVVIDVGANIGNHTVFFAGVMGAPVVAVEPDPANLALLQRNLAVNGLAGRVQVHACALGAAQQGGAVSLDAVAGGGEVGLIRIGAQAACDVLRGAAETITAYLPDIVVTAEAEARFREVAALLLGHGYVPRARYGWSAAYWFQAADQPRRMARVLAQAATPRPAPGRLQVV